MKKTLSLILAVIFTLGCLMLASCGAEKNGTEIDLASASEIVIGVYEPASGDNGPGGKQETLGIRYANSIKPTVTLDGKEYKVTLKIVDNQSSNDKAPSAAADLIAAKSLAVLGSYGSGVSIAAGESFKNAKVPAIGVTCTNPQVTEGNDYYFRVCFLDPFQGTVLAGYAKDLGVEKAYVLAQQGNDYDVGLSNYFKAAFGEENCIYETFPKDNADFTSYVQKAIDNGAGVIFSPTSTSYAQLIIAKAAALGYTGTILAGDTWDSNQIISAAKDKDVKVEVTTFYQEGANAGFDDGFRAWLNSDSQLITDNGGDDMVAAVSAMGYDAYMTALYAIEHAEVKDGKLTSVAVRDSIAAMKDAGTAFTGVTGIIYFNATGDAVRDTAFIKKVNTADGKWDFVKEQKAN